MSTSAPDTSAAPASAPALLDIVTSSLEADKAIDAVVVDLAGKTTIADAMVVATGTSQRHLDTMAEKLVERLKAAGYKGVVAEGVGESSWVLIDAFDVIVHLFRAETRELYAIEKLWSVAPPAREQRVALGAD
ncbi:ribosome silencing factor [Geminicoccaceae bacterium 1502E]|uniref:Ribosomal silencing factor RsfS n=1 Tax=Marinimicrococcus flavescens TaxID=3031815 RepID=A0AAP3V1W7_9PROT|nr:ribosome silencing factor [Marinimicrococcus flavescens]MDX6748240.1 ribosome silencing factor [Geminicoccaceae bacterium 1502E]